MICGCHLFILFNSCSLDPVPKPGMPLPPHALAHPRMPADHLSGVKQMSVVPRGSPVYPQQQLPEMFYSDTRPPPSGPQYEPSQYPPGKSQGHSILNYAGVC